MIQVLLPFFRDDEYALEWDYKEVLDKPAVRMNKYYQINDSDPGHIWYVVSIPIHNWCRNLNIDYDLKLDVIVEEGGENNYWYICFEKESDAVLFKLTWCGNV